MPARRPNRSAASSPSPARRPPSSSTARAQRRRKADGRKIHRPGDRHDPDRRHDHRDRRAGRGGGRATDRPPQDRAARSGRRNPCRRRRRGRFQRGVTEYPNIGDAAMLLTERELRLVYGAADADHAHIGDLQQNSDIGVHIDIDNLVSRHFAILGATGVGKSSGVAIILQKILDTRPNLRIFLVDPHNEYGRCFGDKAQVLNPRNLRLPFWLFNFEETVDAFFGGRPGVEEEVEILVRRHSAGQVGLSAIPRRQRPRARQEARSARRRLHRRHAGALPHRGPDQPARRAHGQAGKPRVAHGLSQADRRAFRPSAIIRATPSCSRTPTSAATPWRKSSATCSGCRRTASR